MDGEPSADATKRITSTITCLLGTQNAVESLTQFYLQEIDAALQENLTSVSVASTRSSRKRSRELGWSDVLEGTNIVIPSIEFNTPYHFLEMNEQQQSAFLGRMNLDTRASVLLRAKIKEALESKCIPSPSSMKWSDVPAILHGNLPRGAPLQNPPDTQIVFDDANIQCIIDIMSNSFRRVSEMEVVVRVFLMLMVAVAEHSDVRIELQPSVTGHFVFTDFLICIRSNKTRQFIEVKRTEINVDLTTESNETAQALREAQILLCTEKIRSPMSFLLTNGTSWSFGSAAKYSDTKIELTHVWNTSIIIDALDGWKTMIMHLKAFLSGTWPSLPPTAAQSEN